MANPQIIKSIAGLLGVMEGEIKINGLPRTVDAKKAPAYVPEIPAMFGADRDGALNMFVSISFSY